MKRVIRVILTGLAICTVAIPDVGSEMLRKLKGNIRDIKDKTTDNMHDLAKGFSKSSTEKTH
jgi:hypothetical protein